MNNFELFGFISMCPFLVDEGEFIKIMHEDLEETQVSQVASSSSDSKIEHSFDSFTPKNKNL